MDYLASIVRKQMKEWNIARALTGDTAAAFNCLATRSPYPTCTRICGSDDVTSHCIATLGAVHESPPEASEAAEQPDAEEANEAAEEDSGIGHIEEQLGLLNYADGEYAPIDSWHLACLSTGLSSNLLPTADTLPAS